MICWRIGCCRRVPTRDKDNYHANDYSERFIVHIVITAGVSLTIQDSGSSVQCSVDSEWLKDYREPYRRSLGRG